jgi:hypothetical protein
MLRVKSFLPAALILSGLVGLGGTPFARAGEGAAPGVADWSARVDSLVRERQPSADEKRFDEIGWTRTIGDAERLAKAGGRPVFLFTHDGRMAIGRC